MGGAGTVGLAAADGRPAVGLPSSAVGEPTREGAGTAHRFVLTDGVPPVRDLLADLWRSRSLVAILARKDFHVRYRRASFGLLWAVALPLLQAVVLALVFSHIVRVETKLDYTVFVYAGIAAWSYFSTTIGTGSTSIVDGASFSTRIYFPRAVFPLVNAAANLYGLVAALVILIALAVVRDVPLDASVVLLIPATLLLAALAGACSVTLAALHVYFRDTRYLVQAAILVWFYVTPIVYPLSLARRYAGWLVVNPMTGVVELVRAAIGAHDDRWLLPSVFWSLGWVAVFVAVGLALHRRFDRVFADLM